MRSGLPLGTPPHGSTRQDKHWWGRVAPRGSPRAGAGDPSYPLPKGPTREMRTARWRAGFRMGRCTASRGTAEKGCQHFGAWRRRDFGQHHQGLLAVGQTADHATRTRAHSARPPPRTMENDERSGHSQAGEAGLLQGPCLLSDLPPGRDQQVGRTDRGPPDCRPPGAKKRRRPT